MNSLTQNNNKPQGKAGVFFGSQGKVKSKPIKFRRYKNLNPQLKHLDGTPIKSSK